MKEIQIKLFKNGNRIKPFLKWAGGKSQLINEIVKRLPDKIKRSKYIKKYIEPFVGGGALFFHLKSYYSIEKAVLIDINRELIICYKVIQKEPNQLMTKLQKLEKLFLSKSFAEREEIYYDTRALYNVRMNDFDYENYNFEWIDRASQTIFFNKTCFNGLFRQNKKGEFNVPMGSYKNPTICQTENLFAVSNALENVEIICGDFTEAEKYITKESVVYYDPPYRPLNNTSSFKDYSKDGFNDKDQIRLANFYTKMHKKGACQILSNSDPKNANLDDDFFDELYKEFKIDRVLANRMINCNGNLRGKIKEIIITNY
ncbi:MAG: Dam family site-specific DNA-(adenine-N6)-methyltransferase [Candidatus Cloacimonetes bacterium]|nr:Dam family site-specific DNA-(adenine-N6)-methyltransferase [Candidatus Cloacimonadota bacterium]